MENASPNPANPATSLADGHMPEMRRLRRVERNARNEPQDAPGDSVGHSVDHSQLITGRIMPSRRRTVGRETFPNSNQCGCG